MKMKKLAVVMVLGGCLSVYSAGAAFAANASGSGQAAISQESQAVDPLLQKQQVIDRYVFEEHAQDLEKKGIRVTNTGVMGDYVEIGITPYSEENAEYLYGILGRDQVNIVEGIQAVTFGAGGAAAEEAGAAIDGVKPVMAEVTAEEGKAAGANGNTLWYVLGGAVVLLAAALGAGKLRARKN